MPWLPRDQRFPLDFDDARLRIGPDHDHAGPLRRVDALDVLVRMVLQRAEDLADPHLKPGGGFDLLENDHSPVLEALVDLLTNRRVPETLSGNAADACAERKIVLQLPDLDACHCSRPHPRPVIRQRGTVNPSAKPAFGAISLK